jgi:hypothetical protein
MRLADGTLKDFVGDILVRAPANTSEETPSGNAPSR